MQSNNTGRGNTSQQGRYPPMPHDNNNNYTTTSADAYDSSPYLKNEQRQQYHQYHDHRGGANERDNQESLSGWNSNTGMTNSSPTATSSTPGLGSIPLQPGEIIDGLDYERPLSAPPPPGFTSGPDERNQRNRLANELLWGPTNPSYQNNFSTHVGGSNNMSMKDDFSLTASHQQQQQQQQPNNYHGGGGVAISGGGGGGGGSGDNGEEIRASSFSNLAAVLGNSLVQSIDDATQERNFNDDLLSYHRMTRHAANRLVGASPTTLHTDHSQYNFNSNSSSNNQLGGPAPATLNSNNFRQNPTMSNPSNNNRGNRDNSNHNNMQHESNARQGYTSSNNDNRLSDVGVEHEPRSTTPVQMYPGQGSMNQRRSLPVKDIGMNVMEPDGDMSHFNGTSMVVSHRIDQNQFGGGGGRTQSGGRAGNQIDPNSKNPMSISINTRTALERGVQNEWRPDAREFRPAAGPPSSNSSISESATAANTDISPRSAELELQPYLWDCNQNKKTSRTIAILHCSYVRAPDVRSACEAYGVLENFRADFASKGFFFASYYDLRSAQYAASELQSVLQRLSVMQRSSEEIDVRYCVSLNASSQFDESQILISDLPGEINEYVLKPMLVSYGALRSVKDQGEGSFIIEYYNVQDAKQALLELDSSQPWGSNVIVEVGLRGPVERKKGRELLAMIGRWRHGLVRPSTDNRQMSGADSGRGGYQATENWQQGDNRPQRNQNNDIAPQTQFILGPDGRYTPVVVAQPAVGGFSHFPGGPTTFDPRQQQLVQGPNGQLFLAQIPQVGTNAPVFLPQHGTIHPQTIVTSTQFVDGNRRVAQTSTPYYTHVVSSVENNSLSGRSHRSGQSQNEEKDTRHLLLDLDNVDSGRDTRTSLMVRNIPNKYTQQMLLNELEENGHGPGIIDFFYLPIDFKNRCNRGYAFVNFVDFKDIIPFHTRYFGKHWRTFNSDKICDITYARIQGKQAMLKRFENSALMEKDDEYKPLVFVSDGIDKGKRLPFPDPNALINNKTRATI